MKNIKLKARPVRYGYQSVFEATVLREFGIGKGSLSFEITSNKYVNEHVQWLWEQFLRHVEE